MMTEEELRAIEADAAAHPFPRPSVVRLVAEYRRLRTLVAQAAEQLRLHDASYHYVTDPRVVASLAEV